MNTIILKITTKEKKIDLKLTETLKAFADLFQFLKNELQIVNDFDVFVKVGEEKEKEQTRLLTEANFKKDFILLNQNTIHLVVFENPNLDSQIQSIITEYEHKTLENKEIDGLSVLASDSKVIESKWISNDELNAKPKKIFSEKCGCCSTELTSLKYICWICDDCILCEKCEVFHDHPVIKYKSEIFSKGVDELLLYKAPKDNKRLVNIFKKDIELTTNVNHTITTQLKKEVVIPIQIKWNGNQNEVYTVIIKNYKDLHVKYDIEEMKNKEEVSNLIITLTPKMYSTAKYSIGVFLNLKEANRNSNSITINLEVNEDKEDEELNEYFVNYPNIVILPKEYKQLIAMTYKEKLSEKTINEIFGILKFHKWNMESAIEDLTQDNQK